jgi:NADPH2:quinone reductase
MRSIAWYGRVLVIGFAAGEIPRVPINLVLLKSCQLVGVFYGAWSAARPDEAAANFVEILDLWSAGKVKPLIGAHYPLEQYAEALRCLSERRAIGKVVVQP